MSQPRYQYPHVEIDLGKLKENLAAFQERCQASSIEISGVVKGFHALPAAAKVYEEVGVSSIASSRMDQLRGLKEAGIRTPLMLIRIPMPSEVEDVVTWSDISLNSECSVLRLLDEAARNKGKTHKVILMVDLGDLREGFWDQDEMLDVCVHVERDLPHVELAGVGVNLGCYGSIQPTPENLGQLVHIARRVEDAIGRKLEIVSGGATSSFTLVHWGTMPEGINHLRIGEGILVSKDLQVDWGIHDMDYLRMDCMTLRAQIVEVKDKPTHPVGPIVVDCFCNRPTYEDRGIRRRAIAGIGRADVGDVMMLRPRTPGMTVVGGSSDHCILDVEDCHPCPRVGDVVDFDVIYLTMLYASAREDVPVVFVD